MFHVILYEPEIPPNTGNIIRLCANTGFELHLVAPLGFTLDERRLRRAGLDYHEWARIDVHPGLAQCLQALHAPRTWAFSSKAATHYGRARFRPGDALLFGPETRGLPPAVLEDIPRGQRLRIPMMDHSRSLNLSNAVAVAAYEAWRQLDFAPLDLDRSALPSAQ